MASVLFSFIFSKRIGALGFAAVVDVIAFAFRVGGAVSCDQFKVEVCSCGLDIRRDEEKADAAGAVRGEQKPAEEGKIKQEQLGLVAVHQPLTCVHALLPRPIGVIGGEVGGQAVGVVLHDAGDEEEKRPEENENRLHNAEDEIAEVARGKAAEGVLNFDIWVTPCHAQVNIGGGAGDGADNEERKGRQCARNERDDEGDERTHQPGRGEGGIAELLARAGAEFGGSRHRLHLSCVKKQPQDRLGNSHGPAATVG